MRGVGLRVHVHGCQGRCASEWGACSLAPNPHPTPTPPASSEGLEFVLQNQTLLIPVCSHEKLPLSPGQTAHSLSSDWQWRPASPHFTFLRVTQWSGLSGAIIQDSGLGFHETTSEMPLEPPDSSAARGGGEGATQAAGCRPGPAGARLAALRRPRQAAALSAGGPGPIARGRCLAAHRKDREAGL